MDYKKLIDPDLKKIATNPPYNRFVILVANLYLRIANRFISIDEGINHRDIYSNGYNNMKMKIEVFEPVECKELLPCLVYYHGGAFSYEASAYHKKLAMIYAKKVHCRVIFPDYHLIPFHTYPAAFEDAMEAYKYVINHTKELLVDENKIGVAGDSAGAMLAAMVTNRCEEEGICAPSLQMLVYPVIGVNLQTESMNKYSDTPVWRSTYNPKMWKYLFNNKEYDYKYSPFHMTISDKIPVTYIETAEYDCLHDDGVLYSDKLGKAGIEVILNETKGTIHGYDSALDADITKRNIEKRIAYLRENFCW